jgi:hypothetical protein
MEREYLRLTLHVLTPLDQYNPGICESCFSGVMAYRYGTGMVGFYSGSRVSPQDFHETPNFLLRAAQRMPESAKPKCPSPPVIGGNRFGMFRSCR